MVDLRPFLPPGRAVTVQLAQGPLYRGTVRRVVDGWLLLAVETGQVLLNLAHVACIQHERPAAGASGEDQAQDEEGFEEAEREEALPRPRSAERPTRVSRALGRAWKEEDLRSLADGYLDGADDTALAERFHRTRAQIKELRQGFECARGNLVEDQISAVARTWIERWRRVLLPR